MAGAFPPTTPHGGAAHPGWRAAIELLGRAAAAPAPASAVAPAPDRTRPSAAAALQPGRMVSPRARTPTAEGSTVCMTIMGAVAVITDPRCSATEYRKNALAPQMIRA